MANKYVFVDAEEINKIMLEHGLNEQDVATLTESSSRSVFRWKKYGTPKNKMELLKMKIKGTRTR